MLQPEVDAGVHARQGVLDADLVRRAHPVAVGEALTVLEIEVADPSDYGYSQPGHRLLFARTVMPFTRESLVVKRQRLIAARMLRQRPLPP